MQFIEIQATVRNDKKTWCGEGFWPLPEDGPGWGKFTEAVAECLMRGILELLKGKEFRMELSGQSIDVAGAIADKVLSSCERWPANDARQITWQERGPRYGR